MTKRRMTPEEKEAEAKKPKSKHAPKAPYCKTLEYDPKKKPKNGRPLLEYDEEIAQEILDTLASQACGMDKLCEMNPHWPSRETIFQWMWREPKFAEKYLVAKSVQVHTCLDAAQSQLEDHEEDLIHSADGSIRMNAARIAKLKMRVDLYKWTAVRLLPKMYGDKVSLIVDDKSKVAKDLKTQMDKIKKNERDY